MNDEASGLARQQYRVFHEQFHVIGPLCDGDSGCGISGDTVSGIGIIVMSMPVVIRRFFLCVIVVAGVIVVIASSEHGGREEERQCDKYS